METHDLNKITNKMENLKVKTEIKVWPKSGLKMSSACKRQFPKEYYQELKY